MSGSFAVCCSVSQYVAVCCSVLQYGNSWFIFRQPCGSFAVCYSVLQCVAVCRSVLQSVAVCCSALTALPPWTKSLAELQFVPVSSTVVISYSMMWVRDSYICPYAYWLYIYVSRTHIGHICVTNSHHTPIDFIYMCHVLTSDIYVSRTHIGHICVTNSHHTPIDFICMCHELTSDIYVSRTHIVRLSTLRFHRGAFD